MKATNHFFNRKDDFYNNNLQGGRKNFQKKILLYIKDTHKKYFKSIKA